MRKKYVVAVAINDETMTEFDIYTNEDVKQVNPMYLQIGDTTMFVGGYIQEVSQVEVFI